MKCSKSFYFFGLLFLFCCFFFPYNAHAETHTYDGHLELKMATGNYQDGLQDGVAVDPSWISGTFPNGNYLIVPGSSSLNYNGYYFVKYFNLYFNSEQPFEYGKTYAIDIDFAYGSYITFTNYYGWQNMISDRTLNFCQGDMSQCSVVWNPVNDSSSSRMTLLYRPNTTSTGFGVSVGSTSNGRFVFWNRYGESQGFKVNQVTITSTQNSGGSLQQDFTAVIEEQRRTTSAVQENTQAVEDNTQAIEDLHDSVTDDSFDDTEAESVFGDFDFYEDNTLSGIITAPLNFIRSLTSECQPLTLRAFNQNLTIQCGTTLFWNRQDVRDFKLFWNILFGGLIIYRLLFKLFKVVNEVLDPTKDSIGGVEI